MSDNYVLKEEAPIMRRSLAWMIANVGPKNVRLPVWLGEQPLSVIS